LRSRSRRLPFWPYGRRFRAINQRLWDLDYGDRAAGIHIRHFKVPGPQLFQLV
jgi:hypothetical protein